MATAQEVPADDLPQINELEVDSLAASISSSMREFRMENGRTYHAYKDGPTLVSGPQQKATHLHCLYLLEKGLHCFSIPPNLSFELDDANDPWIFSGKFDFIHCRQHHCAINEKHMFEQAME
ncbi:hypothetical protein LTR28_005427 [Elasticomyces elasticus]|nr:hypothetical protein LTR28_005427 [Elasticomyces elasticus]